MAEAHWLEVSLTTDDEMAEAVAEVLSRFVSQGVVLERSVKFLNDEDEGTPDGPVRVYGYLVIDERVEENRQRIAEALWHLGQIRPLAEPAFRPIVDQNWMAAWKEHYRPIPIGKKLIILPAWIEQQDAERVAVKIDPSMAFGTGTHPTTQLCMQAIETYVQPERPVVDVGCGSGILSIAALKLGASHALAVDIDNAAVLATRENATSNEVNQRVEAGLGSIDEVLAGKFSIRQAPLVLANILAPVLIRLFEAGLAELIEPGGVIVLSGVLDSQAAGVVAAGKAKGLQFVEQLQMTDWVAIILRR